jgi:hypothetical protein
LIGDGASTLPLNLNSNSSLIQCTTKNLFQSGSKDIFYISSFESIDVGEVGCIFNLNELKVKKFSFNSYFIYKFGVIVVINCPIIVKVLKLLII